MKIVGGQNDYNDMSLTNRLNCSRKQYLNLRKTLLKDELILAGGVGASVGTAAAVSKSQIAQNVIKKGISKIKEPVVKLAKKIGTNKYVQKGISWIKGLPGPAKIAGAAVALLTLGLVNSNHRNSDYNAGKITQEYVDKSKLEKK